MANELKDQVKQMNDEKKNFEDAPIECLEENSTTNNTPKFINKSM